jgi:uncharacterized membrane protein
MFLGISFCADVASARENVTDWYIKDFDSTIVVNKDSSLDITEKITADCGNAAGKHGIFRILPERINIAGTNVKTPVELVSITDVNGSEMKYTESRNSSDGTVTWKIGDANKTVQGVNNYEIRYRVKNTIRFGSLQFDELYWNLSGNFWDLEIDRFHAKIVFPTEIKKENSEVEYYTGFLNSKGKDLATFRWSAPNVLEFESTGMLDIGEGITASVTFPKGIITEYVPSFWEKYGNYVFLLIPLVVFILCYRMWSEHGKDPRVDKTVIAEYDAPDNLSPIEMGALRKNGSFDNGLITAEIVNLAVKGLILIKETHDKVLFFDSKDYQLQKIQNAEEEAKLNSAQKMLLQKLFDGRESVKLSSLKNSFYKSVQEISKEVDNILVEKDLVVKSSKKYAAAFLVVGIFMIFATFFFWSFSAWLGLSLLLSGIIILVFGFIMPSRTMKGAELNWQIKGFKLFMETVDKDRAVFYEKENIFEKFLPYAIMFGITGIWIKRMKEIYGEEYFATYAPMWYAGNVAAFDADSFSSTVDSLSSAIAANTSSPSGSGGAGGSGGGGGGGGGGGW